MGYIILYNANFNPQPTTNQIVTVEYRKITDPQVDTIHLWSQNVLLLFDGTFSPPLIIDGLDDNSLYEVYTTMNCGGTYVTAQFYTIQSTSSTTLPQLQPPKTTIPVTTTTTIHTVSCPSINSIIGTMYSTEPTTTTTSTSTTTSTTTLVPTTTTTTSIGTTTTTTTTIACPTIISFTAHAFTGNITTTTITPQYTKCVDCSPTMTLMGGLSTLDASTLTSSSCTVGDYVIDWYLNTTSGTPSFTSGSSTSASTDVSVVHPFAGEPAQGGTWHPIIRSVYLDGIKYSSTNNGVDRYAPDLLNCLPTVDVTSLTCSNGAPVTSSNGMVYSQVITYTNNSDSPTSAARSFRFDLDGTNPYFVWDFIGYSVSDNIKITYVHGTTETTIENWTVGTDLSSGWSVITNPKTYGRQRMSKITGLTAFTFAPGDYLRINITPSSNANTNWAFYCKCLPTIDCTAIYDSTIRKIVPGSVAMAWNATTCTYDLTYQHATWTPGGSALYNYSYKEDYYFTGQNSFGFSTNTTLLQMRKATVANFGNTGNINNCAALTGTATVTQTGSNTLTIVFTDSSDYNFFKTDTATTLAATNMSDYSSDPASYLHYKYIVYRIKIASSCGDTLINRDYYTHYSNPATFNDGTLTMTLTKATITNGYVSTGPCDQMVGAAAQVVTSVNSTGNWPADYSTVTHVRTASTITLGGYYIPAPVQDVDRRFKVAEEFPNVDVCDLGTKGFTNAFLPQNQWTYYLINDRLVITNTSDPFNNFEFYRWVPVTSGIESANYALVYKKEAGIVTDNIAAYNLT